MKLSDFNMKTEFSILGVMWAQNSAHLFLAFPILKTQIFFKAPLRGFSRERVLFYI